MTGKVRATTLLWIALLGLPAPCFALDDVVGDIDNFGFGTGYTGPIPAYFDNDPMGPGIFDASVEERGNNEFRTWTHFFDLGGSEARFVQLRVREAGCDQPSVPPSQPRIIIDGLDLPLANDGLGCPAFNGMGVEHFFNFFDEDAAFANDGVVEITVYENFDDIALDYSYLTVVPVDGFFDVNLMAYIADNNIAGPGFPADFCLRLSIPPWSTIERVSS